MPNLLASVGMLIAAAGVLWLQAFPSAQIGPPDLILLNGKIVTIDERFTIAQAVAVRGERVLAVGTNQDIARLAGPSTRRLDLGGRTVLPGLIDNHMHLLRYGTTWKYEVRWDGVESRKDALALLRARAATVAAGEWIYTLGGWALEQFADDSRPFTREELDAAAPNHPVFLVFCITTPAGGGNVEQLLGRIAEMKVFTGDNYVDHIAFGENFGALSDPMFRRRPATRPEDLVT